MTKKGYALTAKEKEAKRVAAQARRDIVKGAKQKQLVVDKVYSQTYRDKKKAAVVGGNGKENAPPDNAPSKEMVTASTSTNPLASLAPNSVSKKKILQLKALNHARADRNDERHNTAMDAIAAATHDCCQTDKEVAENLTYLILAEESSESEAEVTPEKVFPAEAIDGIPPLAPTPLVHKVASLKADDEVKATPPSKKSSKKSSWGLTSAVATLAGTPGKVGRYLLGGNNNKTVTFETDTNFDVDFVSWAGTYAEETEGEDNGVDDANPKPAPCTKGEKKKPAPAPAHLSPLLTRSARKKKLGNPDTTE